MPPVRTSDGRASRACEACRARKTRCYESGQSSACLRCTTLALPCSLQRADSSSVPRASAHNCVLVEQRLSYLEKTVEDLKSLIGHVPASPSKVVEDAYKEHGEHPALDAQGSAAPLVVIQDAASDAALAVTPPEHDVARRLDAISKGLVTEIEVEQLLAIFQRHYGRWIGLDETGPPQLHTDTITTPLLLCACCLIAVRHSQVNPAPVIASRLFVDAKALLAESMLQAQNTAEFYQAVLILSLWSTTLEQKLMSIDGWLISGFALQHGFVSELSRLKPVMTPAGICESSYNDGRSVWIHLCLAHLHACVTMRRRSILGSRDIDRIRKSLSVERATNFDLRMAAEACLYWTIYEQCVNADVNLPRARAALQAWKEEWAFLFDQPRRQFLQTSFFFAGLLTYEQSLSSRSAAVRESVVAEMVKLSSDILSLSIETEDERTKHLTDHVYHVITFAAVTLCRLLCRYEAQLQSRFDLSEKDTLITKTIGWLREIYPGPHIGKVMSTLISNVQNKLRPAAHLDDPVVPSQDEPDITAIPDFLTMEDYFDYDWDAMIPDWQSLASEDLLNVIPP